MISIINLLLIFTISMLGISSQLFAEESNEKNQQAAVKEQLDTSDRKENQAELLKGEKGDDDEEE